MSRIGNKPVSFKPEVQISVSKGNVVSVKGPKGELNQQIDPDMKIKIENNTIIIERPTDQKRHKALHGLYRTIINNMIGGVTQGYKQQLELVGVGYRANNKGQLLDLVLGYSHHVLFEIPKEVKLSTEMQKGQNPIITLESNDKQLIGQVAAKIRSLRKPEPYKGKGIKYSGEYIRRKAGKAAAKATA